jgi:hypothetical protein
MGHDAEQDVYRWHATSVNVPPQLPSLGRMNTLASWAGQLARALLQELFPAAGRIPRASPPGHAAWHPFSALTLICWKPPWLHDIGYASGLALTGLHQLDGARYLRDAQHADAMLCRLVAYHSCAIIEAGERGLAEVLGLEFESAPQELSSTLTYCDMTTSPDGSQCRSNSGRRDT